MSNDSIPDIGGDLLGINNGTVELAFSLPDFHFELGPEAVKWFIISVSLIGGICGMCCLWIAYALCCRVPTFNMYLDGTRAPGNIQQGSRFSKLFSKDSSSAEYTKLPQKESN